MNRIIESTICRGGRDSAAGCLELPIVAQTLALEERVRNIEGSVALLIKDENLSGLGLADRSTVPATLELGPAA
jgi:hypothetical protein